MGVVERFNRKLKQLKDSIDPVIQETIAKHKPLIIDQQTEEQMFEGKDSQGLNFIPKYALSTKAIKKKKGQPTSRVTLKDSGDLYKSITVDANTNEMIIKANVEYFKYLVVHYNRNKILGLDRAFLEKFTEKLILPNLKTKWKAIIR